MRWLDDNWIGNVLSRGSRILLGVVSAVFGVVVVVSAPPTDQAAGFYLVALFCLLICIACIGNSRFRHFVASAIGIVLVAGSLWYVFEVATKGPDASRLGPPSLLNALVLFLVFGIPGFIYAATARFGFRRAIESLSWGANHASPSKLKPVFYRVDPWNLVIGVVVIIFGFIQIARSTSLWLLLAPLLIFIYTSVKRETLRSLSLKNRGYYPGRRLYGYWLYEEVQGFNLVALLLPVENTEPGHWELFIPDDAKWRASVPEWARDRHKEIALRIAESWKPKDFHLPDDLKGAIAET
jgi:hypothetical protein